MNYPQQSPFPPDPRQQWQGGASQPSPYYGQPFPPPPPRRSPVGLIVLIAGGVAIVGLVVAISVVLLVRGDEPGRTAADASSPSPRPTADDTPEPTFEWTPEAIPEEVPEEVPDDTSYLTGVFPDAVDGTWWGTMTQYDPDGVVVSSWDLELYMAAGESLGTAELDMGDGVTCRWDILATGNTDDTVDIEYYTTDDGGGTCTQFGFVHLIADDGLLFTGVASEWGDGRTTTADGALAPM